jgi:hypothetical protein
MACQNFTDLLKHYGHEVVVARYTDNENEVHNVGIECEDCHEVLLDFDRLPEAEKEGDSE